MRYFRSGLRSGQAQEARRAVLEHVAADPLAQAVVTLPSYATRKDADRWAAAYRRQAPGQTAEVRADRVIVIRQRAT